MASNELLRSLGSRFWDRTYVSLHRVFKTTESPLEEALLWGLVLEMEAVVVEENALFYPRMPSVDSSQTVPEVLRGAICGGYFDVNVVPQAILQAGEVRYRLDFAVSLRRDTGEGEPVYVDVEVDGHDFHEKTKEQAEHDKERDRLVQAEGWAVARFTGSEVYRDPVACAKKVYALAEALAHRQNRKDR